MNTREQRLAIGLLIVLLGGAAWLGFDQLNSWKRRLNVAAAKLKSEAAETDELLRQEKTWQARLAWLANSQPLFTNRKEAEFALIDLIIQSAKKNGVEIVKNQPADPVDRPDLVAPTMIVDAKGDFDKVNQWLHDLQKPEAFLSIPALRLLPDQEDTSKVVISLSLQKWFRKTQS